MEELQAILILGPIFGAPFLILTAQATPQETAAGRPRLSPRRFLIPAGIAVGAVALAMLVDGRAEAVLMAPIIGAIYGIIVSGLTWVKVNNDLVMARKRLGLSAPPTVRDRDGGVLNLRDSGDGDTPPPAAEAPTLSAEALAAGRAKSDRQNWIVMGVIGAMGAVSGLFLAPEWLRTTLLAVVILAVAGFVVARNRATLASSAKSVAPFALAAIALATWMCVGRESANEKEARAAVRGRLKAPSTAKFVATNLIVSTDAVVMSGMTDPAPERPPASMWSVVVDAQNPFGVPMRESYCVVLEEGSEPVVFECSEATTEGASAILMLVSCRKLGMAACRSGLE